MVENKVPYGVLCSRKITFFRESAPAWPNKQKILFFCCNCALHPLTGTLIEPPQDNRTMPWNPSVVLPNASGDSSNEFRPPMYGTRLWKRVRMYKLRINQRCERCRDRLAEEVHHCNADASDNRPSNLVALCRDCHCSITVSERMRRG